MFSPQFFNQYPLKSNTFPSLISVLLRGPGSVLKTYDISVKSHGLEMKTFELQLFS